MNYFAHLYFAQPTSDSFMGNLLGDFRKGTDISTYSTPVQAAVQNHLLVDRITDNHPQVRLARSLFSAKTRRFSSVALDVLFDHYLIQQWQHYHSEEFEVFKAECYRRLNSRLSVMPASMRQVVESVITRDWFGHYASFEGALQAIENITRRIRFSNQFAGITDEIQEHDVALSACFDNFFPELISEVRRQGIEKGALRR